MPAIPVQEPVVLSLEETRYVFQDNDDIIWALRILRKALPHLYPATKASPPWWNME